jgi:hypothetical protein
MSAHEPSRLAWLFVAVWSSAGAAAPTLVTPTSHAANAEGAVSSQSDDWEPMFTDLIAAARAHVEPRPSTFDAGALAHVETRVRVLDTFLQETQIETCREYRDKRDQDTPLAAKRFYEFSRRGGAMPGIAQFDLPEGSDDDQKIIGRAAGRAAQRASVETRLFEFVDRRSRFVESFTNWSLARTSTGSFGSVTPRSDVSRNGGADEATEGARFDTVFSLQQLVRTPKDAAELRFALSPAVAASVYPLNEHVEVHVPLVENENFTLSAGGFLNEGDDRTLFMVSVNFQF